MPINQADNDNSPDKGLADPGELSGAKTPSEISAKDWRAILWRVKEQLNTDNVSLSAAGVGLFALLSAFPALAAAVSLYGLVMSPAEVVDQISSLAAIIPADALDILKEQVATLAAQQDGSLGLSVLIGLVTALWSARKGMVALIQACNIAYEEKETRGFFRQLSLSLIFTFGAIIYFLLILLIGVALPLFAEMLRVSDTVTNLIVYLRWPFLWMFIVIALAVIYRYAPSRRKPKWRWVTWGSVIAATLWIMGSIGFAIYVRTIGSYGETYGAIGNVIVLLLWLYLSGYIVILGAEINSEMELQTPVDTTVGHPRPLGKRGAYVADHLPED